MRKPVLIVPFLAIPFLALALLFAGAARADEVSPLEVAGATTVSTQEAKRLFDQGIVFVDVRSNSDWEAGRIPGAKHLELKKVFSAESLSRFVGKDTEVVFYCNGESCPRSSQASALAVEWGFTRVHYYRDGFPAWKTAGLPVE